MLARRFSVVLLALPAAAVGQNIPVVNGNFESPILTQNEYTQNGITGWTAVGGSGVWGVFYPTTAAWLFTAPEGHQVGYTNGTTIEQVLTTLTAPSTTYTLRVDEINRPTYGGHSYFVEFYAGNTLLARDNNSLSLPVGGYLTSVLVGSIPASGPLVGVPLKIRLGGLNQTDFDDVRVSTGCYANCDGSTSTPVLNVQDFTCFLQQFAAASAYANCDGSTSAPVLNVQDFTCFLQKFAAGCS